MSLHPLLRRAATPAVPPDLRWDEPLKLQNAAAAWAIAVGQAAESADDVKGVRASAAALADAGEAELLAAADDMSLPAAPAAEQLRLLLRGVEAELLRLLASRGDVPGGLPKPKRARGPNIVGSALSENLRRTFGTWLSWDVFDPYSRAQLAWGAAACAADLARRLDEPGRLEEAERIDTLLQRWDTVSLLALERCSLGSWLESDLTEDALAGVLGDIVKRLREPPAAPPAGARPRTEALPIGNVDWPVGMATRFDTPNVQLQAKRRAERLVEAERPPPTIFVDGRLFPNMVSYVVASTGADGFGNGAVVERDSLGRPKPGRPVSHVFQLRQARVIFANEGSASRWGIVTYFPTDEQVLS